MNKEEVLKKLKEDIPLTREEELFYLIDILGHSPEEAERIIEIAENNDPTVLID